MAIERKTIKTLTGGVSQQPHALRRDNQCTEQVNFLSDPIKGLVRRPGSKFMGNAPTPAPGLNSTPANTFTHIINRDDDTQLLLAIKYNTTDTTPDMGLYDMQTGAEIDIKSADGTIDAVTTYLGTTSTAYTPGTPYEAVTIADHTFVLNKSKTVALTSNTSHGTGHYEKQFGKRGMIFVKEGAYNAEYSVTAVDNDSSVRKLRVTTSGGLSGGEKDSKTDNIAAAIEWGLSADGKTIEGASYFGTGKGNDEDTQIRMTVHDDGTEVIEPATDRTFNDGATQITFEIEGSVVSWYADYGAQTPYDASGIKVEVSDSYGDTMTSGISNTRESFEGLPVVAPNNYLLKIEGAPESKLDDYHVHFVADDPMSAHSDLGRGKWEETMDVVQYYELDEETMPYKLVKFSDTEYRWMPGEWEDKTVGDSATDPEPAFVQNTISDLFFFKGRLGFLTGETMVMSELDNPFNFWRTTTSQVLATDRISVSSSVNEITVFNYAVPFSNQLILFSDRTQFIVNYGSGGLTPMTTSLALISRYESSRFARPVSNDNSVIFAQRRSTSTAIYEMYPTGATDLSFEAKNISEQINNYIVGEVVKIETSSLAGAVVVQTDLQDNLLYVYRYYDRARERIVSSWSRYEMGCSYVISYFFVGNVMRMVDVTLPFLPQVFTHAKVAFNELRFDNTASLPFSVDGYYTFASSDISWDNTDTTLTVPWSPEALGDADEFSFIVFDDTGVVYTTGTTTSTTVVVPGENLTGLNVTIGMKFTSTYTFSHQYLRGGEGGKESLAITDGRTTVKWVEVYLEDTQHIKAEVSFPTEVNKTSSSKTFSGTAAGGIDYGDRESEGSYLRLFVGARNDVPTITLSSDTHEAATVVGASFEMIHTSRLSRTS